MSRPPIDDTGSLREVAKLVKRGLTEAEAARTVAATTGDLGATQRLRRKAGEARRGRSITPRLRFSLEEWQRIEAAADGRETARWLRSVILKAAGRKARKP